MAHKKNRTGRRLILLGIPSLVLICFFIYNIGDMIFQMKIKKEEELVLEAKFAELLLEEEKVESQLEKLRDPDYVARYAREKYLYSKDGEFIIKIP